MKRTTMIGRGAAATVRQVALSLTALASLLVSAAIWAHPLGNNTVSRAADIEIGAAGIQLRYQLDLAEIPTLLAAAEADTDGDGATSDVEWDAFARQRGEAVAEGIEMSVDGKPLELPLEGAAWRLIPGKAGLATLRLTLRLGHAFGDRVPTRVSYRDRRQPAELGWKEVVARAGPGIRILASDVPSESPTADLNRYPGTQVPLAQVLTASLRVAVSSGSGPDASAARAGAGPADAIVAESPSGLASGRWGFLRLGVFHIAVGLDHLAFLLGLVAGTPSLRRLAWVVTAFTAAHTLSLVLVASGLILPPAGWIEAAIGMTILYVGIAGLRGGLRHGPGIAFCFGLIHGFGLAGALIDHLNPNAAGLGWILDVAVFNLGVEVGQLGFVLLLVSLSRALQPGRVPWPSWASRVPAGVTVALGAFWSVERLGALFGIPPLSALT